MKSIYKRIIIKLSGEALSDEKDKTILDRNKLEAIAKVVEDVVTSGVSVGIVVGAGNIWRGRMSEKIGIEQATGDYMGMIGTILNALAIQNAIEKRDISCRVMSSIDIPQVCEPYLRRKAIHHLDKGVVVIFAGGTGNPYFTTDSTATLRALECKADAILMGKNGIDGVYDKDPRTHADAKFLDHLTFHQVVEQKLEVMDLTAVAMLEGTDLVIRVFSMDDSDNFLRVLNGDKVGTTITNK